MCIRAIGLKIGVLALLLTGVATEALPLAAQAESIYQRAADAQAVITGSRGLYDGTFRATGTSSICGEIPKEASLTGMATFVIEFPSDTPRNASITTITFGSTQLVEGATTAASFRLMVGVRSANVGQPPNYVLNTDSNDGRNRGTATLSRSGQQTALHVAGQNDKGEAIDLTVTCG